MSNPDDHHALIHREAEALAKDYIHDPGCQQAHGGRCRCAEDDDYAGRLTAATDRIFAFGVRCAERAVKQQEHDSGLLGSEAAGKSLGQSPAAVDVAATVDRITNAVDAYMRDGGADYEELSDIVQAALRPPSPSQEPTP